MTRCLILFLCAAIAAAPQDEHPHKDDAKVRQVARDELKAFSAEDGKLVIGTLKDEGGNGHVVIVKPGSDRVWDGNTLGGFKDVVNGTKISNERVIKRMNNFIREQFGANAPDVSKAKPHELQKYLDHYVQKGAPASHSWTQDDLKKVEWYQVPSDRKVKDIVKNYEPPAAKDKAHENLRCNDLLQKAAPIVKDMVKEEVKPGEGQKAPYVNANNIDEALRTRSAETRKTEAPPIPRPAEPVAPPIHEDKPRERPVETKPGGVIITACAEIEGVQPNQVASAAFDAASGTLTLTLANGSTASCSLDADDFTIAVRSIFDRQVDPSLSMSYSDKPGYHAVNYCGPLFRTKFGKIMYRTDNLLGDIIFNQEGDHRTIVAGIIPNFAEMACESDRTMTTGSRVFLRAHGARFSLDRGRLIGTGVQTRVDVEGLRYAADYFQESLHRLARAMDEHFDALAENFEEFREFRRLAQCVGLAKYLKRHSIAFDWSALKTRAVAEHDFPAYSPTVSWYCLYNGRNLDGWKVNLSTNQIEWSLEEEALSIAPSGPQPFECFYPTWRTDYDLRYTVVTRGPVEFIIREGASVVLDTQGRPQKIELFITKGEWTAVAPGFGRKGSVVVPEPKEGEPRKPSEFGIRVPPGSKLTIFTASLRMR